MWDFQHWPETSGVLDFLKTARDSWGEIGSTPYEVLEQAGSVTLRKYKTPAKGDERAQPILILPSLINRSFILDLLPEKSLIRRFLDQGHDVYLVDWGIPLSHERYLSFEKLLTLHLDLFLKRIHLDCGGRKLHLVGHCLGGTLGLVVANLQPRNFLSLTLVTTPVRFQENDKLSLWCRNPHFNIDAFIEAYGNVPWALLQAAFLALKPTQMLAKRRQLKAKGKDQNFLRNFWAMEIWSHDNVNFRGECFKILLQDLYRMDSLVKGTLEIDGRYIDLRRHKLPTFVLIAKSDHIVSEGSHLSPEMVPLTKDFVTVTAEGGHVGALLGGRSQKLVWPELTEWMASCEV